MREPFLLIIMFPNPGLRTDSEIQHSTFPTGYKFLIMPIVLMKWLKKEKKFHQYADTLSLLLNQPCVHIQHKICQLLVTQAVSQNLTCTQLCHAEIIYIQQLIRGRGAVATSDSVSFFMNHLHSLGWQKMLLRCTYTIALVSSWRTPCCIFCMGTCCCGGVKLDSPLHLECYYLWCLNP